MGSAGHHQRSMLPLRHFSDAQHLPGPHVSNSELIHGPLDENLTWNSGNGGAVWGTGARCISNHILPQGLYLSNSPTPQVDHAQERGPTATNLRQSSYQSMQWSSPSLPVVQSMQNQKVTSQVIQVAPVNRPIAAEFAPPPSAPLSDKENVPAVQHVPASKKRARGAGSRSGAMNRRAGGGSDDEIAKLSPASREATQLKLSEVKEDTSTYNLTEDDKLRIVEWLTDEKQWPEMRIKQAIFWVTLSQKILAPPGRITPTQIRNYWSNQAWPKYKAVREMEEHTGGGDGDDDDDEESPSDKYGGFSKKVLEKFKNSVIYEMINKVARDDSTVIRHRDFNSRATISDSSDESTTTPLKKKLKKTESKEDITLNSLLQSAVTTMQMKVELAKRREEREDEDRRRRLNRDEWQRAMMMLEHSNPIVRAEGEALVKELHAQRGM
ncbi:hypothetical protein F5887DRAFT_920968 [Amanita rubescens]|nr:hypothetical protein F5887DRAFT_920968 [Amanita rubescens]